MNYTPYKAENGKPKSQEYLECGLPPYLKKQVLNMKDVWEAIDNDKDFPHKDAYYDELQSSINVAEVEEEISKEQAHYLRVKYLRLEEREI